MAFKDIQGQDLVVQFLKNSIKNNYLSHAYLFIGPKGVGKETTALAFAQGLNCLEYDYLGDSCNKWISCRKFLGGNQPDINIIKPSGLSIKIDQIRELKNKAFYKSYESKYKVIIIDDAHLLTDQASNSLLKILEEPPQNTIFILVTPEPQQLLETINSRCQQVNFNYLSDEIVSLILREKYPEYEQGAVISKFARGSVGEAIEMLNQGDVLENRDNILSFLNNLEDMSIERLLAFAEKWDKDREGVKSFLEIAQIWFRDHLVWKVTGEEMLVINQDYLKQIKTGKYTLDRINRILQILHSSSSALKYNVNPRLILEIMLLKIKKG